MARIIFILMFLFSFLEIFGQSNDLKDYQDTVFIKYKDYWGDDPISYVTDTVIVESGLTKEHILVGTSILQGRHNSFNDGLDFVKITKSDCQKDVTEYGGGMQDHINSILITDSTVTIDINIYDNCCYAFLCDIAVDTAGTLNLIYIGYGLYCACDCCFGLTYHFEILKETDIVDVKSEIKSVMINGDINTIKSINWKTNK